MDFPDMPVRKFSKESIFFGHVPCLDEKDTF